MALLPQNTRPADTLVDIILKGNQNELQANAQRNKIFQDQSVNLNNANRTRIAESQGIASNIARMAESDRKADQARNALLQRAMSDKARLDASADALNQNKIGIEYQRLAGIDKTIAGYEQSNLRAKANADRRRAAGFPVGDPALYDTTDLNSTRADALNNIRRLEGGNFSAGFGGGQPNAGYGNEAPTYGAPQAPAQTGGPRYNSQGLEQPQTLTSLPPTRSFVEGNIPGVAQQGPESDPQLGSNLFYGTASPNVTPVDDSIAALARSEPVNELPGSTTNQVLSSGIGGNALASAIDQDPGVPAQFVRGAAADLAQGTGSLSEAAKQVGAVSQGLVPATVEPDAEYLAEKGAFGGIGGNSLSSAVSAGSSGATGFSVRPVNQERIAAGQQAEKRRLLKNANDSEKAAIDYISVNPNADYPRIFSTQGVPIAFTPNDPTSYLENEAYIRGLNTRAIDLQKIKATVDASDTEERAFYSDQIAIVNAVTKTLDSQNPKPGAVTDDKGITQAQMTAAAPLRDYMQRYGSNTNFNFDTNKPDEVSGQDVLVLIDGQAITPRQGYNEFPASQFDIGNPADDPIADIRHLDPTLSNTQKAMAKRKFESAQKLSESEASAFLGEAEAADEALKTGTATVGTSGTEVKVDPKSKNATVTVKPSFGGRLRRAAETGRKAGSSIY